MASCDAYYRFTWVDIGHYGEYKLLAYSTYFVCFSCKVLIIYTIIPGCVSDCSLWNNCDFGKMLEEGNVDLPPPKNLPGTNIATPHAFVGDEAFPLKSYTMRPYSRRQLEDSERVFNYRLSRTRRVIENAFGILVMRRQVLLKTLCSSAENVSSMVKALVCLHNFLMSDDGFASVYCPPNHVDHDNENHEQVDGEWRRATGDGQFQDVPRLGANNARGGAVRQRDLLRDYFISPEGEDQAPWQYARAFRGLVVDFEEVVEADDESD